MQCEQYQTHLVNHQKIISKRKCKRNFPGYFKIRDSTIDNPSEIVNHFYHFFAGVGFNLSNSTKISSDKTLSIYLKQTILSSQTVPKTIQNLASKHRSGDDGISTNFLKRIAHVIIGPLTVMINHQCIALETQNRQSYNTLHNGGQISFQ